MTLLAYYNTAQITEPAPVCNWKMNQNENKHQKVDSSSYHLAIRR